MYVSIVLFSIEFKKGKQKVVIPNLFQLTLGTKKHFLQNNNLESINIKS